MKKIMRGDELRPDEEIKIKAIIRNAQTEVIQ